MIFGVDSVRTRQRFPLRFVAHLHPSARLRPERRLKAPDRYALAQRRCGDGLRRRDFDARLDRAGTSSHTDWHLFPGEFQAVEPCAVLNIDNTICMPEDMRGSQICDAYPLPIREHPVQTQD